MIPFSPALSLSFCKSINYGVVHTTVGPIEAGHLIFLNCCLCCVTGQHNALRGQHELASFGLTNWRDKLDHSVI